MGSRGVSAASPADDADQSLKAFTKVYSTGGAELRRPGEAGQGHLQRRDPGHAADARSALEFLRSQGLRRRCAKTSAATITASACRCRPRNGKTIVMAPFAGSPAYQAGLRPGDVILRSQRQEDRRPDHHRSRRPAERAARHQGAGDGRPRRRRPSRSRSTSSATRSRASACRTRSG